MTELLGHSGDFALFGDGTHDGLTVIVSTKTLDTFDPQPFAGIDPTRWEEADEALAPTEAWELAETALGNAKQITGTDVIIAAGDGDKRSFAIPKAVQVEAQKALKWRKEHGRGGTDVGMNTARTLAKGGSIGIQKVRHCNRYFARHEVDKSGKGWSPGDDGYPSNGKIAWALWGGEAAWKWTNGILRREKDLAVIAAADDIATPPAPAEVEDAAQDAPVPELDEEAEFTESELDGDDYAPDQPHPYLPNYRMGYLCEVCLGSESSAVHLPESETPIAAAGADVNMRLEDSTVNPKARRAHLVDAEKFFGVDLDGDDVPDFFVGVEYRADGTPSMVTGVYMLRGEQWMHWNPKGMSWSPGADPADADIAPVDDDGAYATALLMEGDGGRAIPASEVNPPEWAMVDEARGAIPDYQAQLMEELTFCVVFEESDCKDCDEGLVVKELYLRTEDDECWRWNPVDIEWQRSNSCPADCTAIDTDAAREIGLRLTNDAHAAMTDKKYAGEYKARPGGDRDHAIGPHLNRPHGRPISINHNRHTVTGYEFDSAFNHAAWIIGYTGGREGFMTPDATATSFASLVDEYAALTADGETNPQSWHKKYTPDERSANASKQFRDALGRFSKTGDTVHVKGGRTGKVKDYDKKSDRVKIKYDDNSEQDIKRDQVTRVGDSEDDSGSDKPKKIDVSKIPGQPRAIATTPKAWLPYLLPPLDRAGLDSAMEDYQAFIERERKRKLETYANLTPETTDVKPLYLAQVDPVDNQAVIELIALVPKSEKSKDLRAFVRKNGRWELDAKMLSRIKSVTPPALVVLDDETYGAVREQVDSFYKEKDAKSEEVTSILRSVTASAPPALWAEDGTLLPAAALDPLDSVAALVAGGVPGVADTPGDIAAARRLRRYWLRGPGAAKIRWNTPGDWTRCVRHLSKYMGPRAKGYCQNLHKSATGVYTGSKFNVGKKRRGLRGDGSALLLALPTKTVAAPGDIAAEGIEEFSALGELNLPTVDELQHLSFRPEGHRLRVGERFLVKGGDGTYVLSILDPTQTLGWDGEPAIICGETLLREKTEAMT